MRRPFLFLLSWVMVSLLGAARPIPQVPVQPTEIRKLVAAAVTTAGKGQVLVDPRILDEMTASAGLFVSNFCLPPDSASGIDACRRTINAPVLMTRIAGDYIADLQARRSEVKVFGARLAESLGHSFADIGWPSTEANTAAVVDLPRNYVGAQMSLRTGTGPIRMGKAGSILLISPGINQIVVSSPPGGQVIRSIEARQRQRLILSAAPPSNAEVFALGDVEASTDLYCYDMVQQTPKGPTQPFNWGRMLVRGERSSTDNLARFVGYRAIDIQVIDETGACGNACMDGLATLFAQAIAAWRSGCERCNENSLTVIRFRNHVWLERRAVRRLRDIAHGAKAPLDLSQRYAAEALSIISPPNPRVPTTTVIAFAEITQDTAVRHALCAQSPSAASWLPIAQQYLCSGPQTGSALVMRPSFSLRRGATSCGPSADFLACGQPGGGIEVTLDNATYQLPSPTGIIRVGTGTGATFALRTVVMHEVGHWFGVPHAEVQGDPRLLDVMAETLGDGRRCISGSSLVMLNNAADARWTYRLTSKQGLRRPRSPRQ